MKKITEHKKLFKKYDITNGQDLTMVYLKMEYNYQLLQLADVCENFVEKATLEYSINPLYSYSTWFYYLVITWKAGLKITKIKLDILKDKKFYYYLKIKSVEDFQV